MNDSSNPTGQTGRAKEPGLILGIDTCGPSGSVALARVVGEQVEILGERELAGKSYSATLVAAVAELLERAGVDLDRVSAIVIANGPGSFTGVRVGVSAAKGLAEGKPIGIVAVSRLEVLAAKAGIQAAALDAHRSEVFLRIGGSEMLAGREELAEIVPAPGRIAVCDEVAEVLLKTMWPETDVARQRAPSAGDAIRLCAGRVSVREFSDLALLDGHYLRRSDAEIFGETGVRTKHA